jgi:transcriptional regulator with XRE-family HTH domain
LPRALRTVGDHVRVRRLTLGLLQREVARQLGVGLSTLAKWERNRSTPPVRYLPRIIRFLGYCPWRAARHRGDMLRQAREAAGLTQRQFATLVGVDPGTLSRWEVHGRPSRPLDLPHETS